MLYLVNCEVNKHYYMNDNGDQKEEKTHIVEAENKDEAEEKVRNYYKSKDDPYYVTYCVCINYCNEMIR